MVKFVFRIDSDNTVKDPPEIVWSSEELCWLVNQRFFKTDNYNNYYRPPEIVKEKSLTAVIIGFKDFYTKERYCAQFAAVVNGIIPKNYRFSVLTIYDNDAKHIVSRLETIANEPVWSYWYDIGNENGKLEIYQSIPAREESEGYFEDINFDEDLEVLAFFAENWAKGKKGLEAGQVFDNWWRYKDVTDMMNTTPNKLS